MDITSYTMVLVCKLWALSFQYNDGSLKDFDLTERQIQKKVVEFPSLLQYLSYVFTSSSCILGPFFEFDDFVNWIEMKGHYKDAPRGLTSGW